LGLIGSAVLTFIG